VTANSSSSAYNELALVYNPDIKNTKGTSGYNELALVYNTDVKSNSGTAYPTTPGHFDEPAACDPT